MAVHLAARVVEPLDPEVDVEQGQGPHGDREDPLEQPAHAVGADLLPHLDVIHPRGAWSVQPWGLDEL